MGVEKMKRMILILGFIVMSMNLMLWVNGDLGSSVSEGNEEILNLYPNLPSGIRDYDSNLDTSHLNIEDTNGDTISTAGESFVTTVLDFIENIPVLGPLLTLFRFAFDFVANITFGITFMAIKWNFPNKYVIFIAALNFAIVTIGLLEIVLDFTRSRGGTGV